MQPGGQKCTKKSYYSEHGATQHMEAILRNNDKRDHRKTVKITKAYECTHCGFWHLTTQEQYR